MYVLLTVLALAGGVFLMFSWRGLRRRRLLRGLGNGAAGISCVLGAALGSALLLNLYTYQRLTHESAVAQLSFRQLKPRQYSVELIDPRDGSTQRYRLQGDEWQLDARILKWTGTANLLGLNAHYRLERLSGRYHDIELEVSEPRSAYALAEQAGLDLWHLAQRYPDWLPFADATYGNATYLPMADRARFEVWVSQSGLLARPANEAAQRALKKWE